MFCFYLEFCLWLLFSSCIAMNPYHVLNVKTTDSPQGITAAYKKLAKKWHPDKNKDPNASAEMVKINEAYGILSNPQRKQKFDQFRSTEENSQQDHYNSPHQFFHEFRKGNSFVFDDFMFGSSFHSHNYQKKNILTRYSYENMVKSDSYHKVFLIAVFNDYCFECIKVKPIWEKMSESLENIGVGIYELYYDSNRHLAHDIGIATYPQIIAVVEGRNVRYKGSDISERTIRDFIHTLLPHSLLELVIENEKEFFERSFKDNKPQCLLFSKYMNPPLLFQLVAFEYHTKVNFASVDVKDLRTKELRLKYNINAYDPAILMVKEEPSIPVAVVRGSALKRGTLRALVTSNLYLFVPRLSSQQLFDDLCPKKYAVDRWLCVVLVVSDNSNFSTHLWKLRQMAKREIFQKRVRFFYIFDNVQKDFVASFNDDKNRMTLCSDGIEPYKLIVLWRHPKEKVLYDWFASGWCAEGSSEELKFFLSDHVSGIAELKYETTIPELKDEHYHGNLWNFIKSSYKVVQHVVDSINSPNWYNMSTITFVMILFFGFTIGCFLPFVSNLIGDPDENRLPRHTTPEVNTTVLELQKLDAKTQKRFIHDSKPGQITVAVIVDSLTVNEVACSPIAQAFADAIYGFTSSSCYTFTYISIAEHLMWCTEIMNINKFGEFLPGTVLAMNGFRKYVYVFKPNIGIDPPSEMSANFIGFESSDDDTDTYQHLDQLKIKKAALRVKRDLPFWLERLCGGTLRDKIKIEKWPTMES